MCKADTATGTVTFTLQCCCRLIITTSEWVWKLTTDTVITHSWKALPRQKHQITSPWDVRFGRYISDSFLHNRVESFVPDAGWLCELWSFKKQNISTGSLRMEEIRQNNWNCENFQFLWWIYFIYLHRWIYFIYLHYFVKQCLW
jgi:hypothetical protein